MTVPVYKATEGPAQLSDPHEVQLRLETIEAELAFLQNEFERAALDWFRAKRDREKKWAQQFVTSDGTVPERKAKADLAVAHIGLDAEAAYEAKKALVRILETRATIGQSILRSQGRA